MKSWSNLRAKRSRLTGQRSSALDLARGRIVFLSGVFMLFYCVLAARAVDLTLIQGGMRGEFNGAELEHDHNQAASDDIRRGEIVDRNGVLVATTIDVPSLYADPHLISDPARAAQKLAQIFPDKTSSDFAERLNTARRFVWLERDITPDQQAQILEIGEPGLGFRYAPRRVYPQGNMLAHVVGYTDVDQRGLAGIERGLNEKLSIGEPVELSIDVRLQHVLRREIQNAVTRFEANGGAGVILDIHSGEVLAGVSYPDFDPHHPGDSGSESLFNRLTLGVYELGSVFKIFSTAAYIDTHPRALSDTFDARDPIRVGRHTISDYHAEDRVLTLPEAFMYSSNIASALMGQEVGDERLYNYYDDLGLFSALRLEVPEVGRPLVPSPWRPVNTLTASFGHGVADSPLQTAVAAATILHDGVLIQPTFLRRDPKENAAGGYDIGIVSPETSELMRRLMRLVVTQGTGKNADVPGYEIGGKTGTAEKTGGRGYDHRRLISSFIGAFPISEPRYLVFVLIDEPKGQKFSYGYATGGWVAAPAFKNIVQSMVAVLGIPPVKKEVDEEYSRSLMHLVSGKGGHDG